MRVFPGSAVAQSAPGSLRVAHVRVAMEGTLLAGCGDSGQHPGGQRSLGSLRLIMGPFPPMRPRSLPRPPPRAAPVTDTQKDQVYLRLTMLPGRTLRALGFPLGTWMRVLPWKLTYPQKGALHIGTLSQHVPCFSRETPGLSSVSCWPLGSLGPGAAAGPGGDRCGLWPGPDRGLGGGSGSQWGWAVLGLGTVMKEGNKEGTSRVKGKGRAPG